MLAQLSISINFAGRLVFAYIGDYKKTICVIYLKGANHVVIFMAVNNFEFAWYINDWVIIFLLMKCL